MPNETLHHIGYFIKFQRSRLKLTLQDLADRAGVGLRFIRDIEQGKESLRMDKVNQVLHLFGHILFVKPQWTLDPYEILLKRLNQRVLLNLKNKTHIEGFLLEAIYDGGEIRGWKFLPATKNSKPEKPLEIPHMNIESIENLPS